MPLTRGLDGDFTRLRESLLAPSEGIFALSPSGNLFLDATDESEDDLEEPDAMEVLLELVDEELDDEDVGGRRSGLLERRRVGFGIGGTSRSVKPSKGATFTRTCRLACLKPGFCASARCITPRNC